MSERRGHAAEERLPGEGRDRRWLSVNRFVRRLELQDGAETAKRRRPRGRPNRPVGASPPAFVARKEVG